MLAGSDRASFSACEFCVGFDELAFDGGFEYGGLVALEVGLDAAEVGDGLVESEELTLKAAQEILRAQITELDARLAAEQFADRAKAEITRTEHGLRVVWSDAHESLYPYRGLRAGCRCASCTGGH